MSRLSDLIDACKAVVREIMPWELVERLRENPSLLLLDVREPEEFAAMHISGSLNIPRGILETACNWDFEDTVPELVIARDREVIVICRSGRRSLFAAYTMQQLGFRNVVSLKTGLRGWNDYEEALQDLSGTVIDTAVTDLYFQPKVRAEQRAPRSGLSGNG